MAEARRLMLGVGVHKREGWTTLDANTKHHPDILATIPPLPAAVRDVQWSEIEWVHGVTSVYPWDAERIIAECFQVLAPGGKLVLEQPDFLKAGQRVDWLFGDPKLEEPLHMNRWAYTPDSLVEVLINAGFLEIDLAAAQHHQPDRDFRLEAYK